MRQYIELVKRFLESDLYWAWLLLLPAVVLLIFVCWKIVADSLMLQKISLPTEVLNLLESRRIMCPGCHAMVPEDFMSVVLPKGAGGVLGAQSMDLTYCHHCLDGVAYPEGTVEYSRPVTEPEKDPPCDNTSTS